MSEASGTKEVSISYQHDFSLRLVNMSVDKMVRGPIQRVMIRGGKYLMFLPQNLTPWTEKPREIRCTGFFVVVGLFCFIFCFGGCSGLLSSFPFWGAGGRMSKGASAKEP